MMGGTMLDLLPRLDAVSSDAREEPGILMPTVPHPGRPGRGNGMSPRSKVN